MISHENVIDFLEQKQPVDTTQNRIKRLSVKEPRPAVRNSFATKQKAKNAEDPDKRKSEPVFEEETKHDELSPQNDFDIDRIEDFEQRLGRESDINLLSSVSRSKQTNGVAGLYMTQSVLVSSSAHRDDLYSNLLADGDDVLMDDGLLTEMVAKLPK